MSLQAINEYVNNLLTSNRDQPHEQITIYFDLMASTAKTMLENLNKAQRLLGLEVLDSSLLNTEEKLVVRQAVDYILSRSDNLAKDLDLLQASGLLSLQDKHPESPYHLRYSIEPMLKRASQLYFNELGWWSAFIQRNKAPAHFMELFEKAAIFKPAILSDGLETAR